MTGGYLNRYLGYEDPFIGWESGLTGKIDLQPLPVYPAGMLIEPFVQELAEKLSICLEKARNSNQ